jgi:hypothetical protein
MEVSTNFYKFLESRNGLPYRNLLKKFELNLTDLDVFDPNGNLDTTKTLNIATKIMHCALMKEEDLKGLLEFIGYLLKNFELPKDKEPITNYLTALCSIEISRMNYNQIFQVYQLPLQDFADPAILTSKVFPYFGWPGQYCMTITYLQIILNIFYLYPHKS